MDYRVMAFSYATEGSVRLSEHFKVYEFRCKDNTDPIFVSTSLVEILESIRKHFNKTVYINSAYRNPAYNAMIGGAKKSMHMYGMAADIHINGVTPKQIAEFAETLIPDTGGIGIYDNFCHIDVRVVKSRWNG